MAMNIIEWIVLGLFSGFIASWIMNNHGLGISRDIVLGIIGALIGGWLFRQLNSAGVTGFNLWSMLVAVVGSMLVLFVWHAVLFRRRA